MDFDSSTLDSLDLEIQFSDFKIDEQTITFVTKDGLYLNAPLANPRNKREVYRDTEGNASDYVSDGSDFFASGFFSLIHANPEKKICLEYTKFNPSQIALSNGTAWISDHRELTILKY